ncbi:MAG: T9SS type A sorting domain-containing protein [Roseivirga sp.]|nr:T9SS type A sorting domain-containing protein [Roseivirga sp.]
MMINVKRYGLLVMLFLLQVNLQAQDQDSVARMGGEISLERIRIFPNPASASGSLNFNRVPAEVKELKFFNTHGRLVKTYKPNKKAKFQINISSFSTAGIMVIKFISEDDQYLGFKRVLLKR